MKYRSIKENKPLTLSVKRACEVLCVSPSGYFKSLKQPCIGINRLKNTGFFGFSYQ